MSNNLKEIKITIPKGFELDTNASNFGVGLIKFKPQVVIREFPKTFEALSYVSGYYVDEDTSRAEKNEEVDTKSRHSLSLYPTKQQAEATVAMAQLLQLRSAYWDSWKPNFADSNIKYAILLTNGAWSVQKINSHNCPFCFETYDLAQKFLSTFLVLLITVQPLLGHE